MIGTARRNRSQYILATEFHEKALKAAIESKNDRLIATSYNNVGVDYRRREMLEKAFDHHFEALKIAERINETRSSPSPSTPSAISTSPTPNTTLLSGNLPAPWNWKKKQQPLGVAINLGNLGYAYEGLNQLDRAIDYYDRSLAVNQQLNNHTGMAICYTCLGTAYQKKGNNAAAMVYLQKALEANEQVEDKVHLAENYLSIGRLLNDEGKLPKPERISSKRWTSVTSGPSTTCCRKPTKPWPTTTKEPASSPNLSITRSFPPI